MCRLLHRASHTKPWSKVGDVGDGFEEERVVSKYMNAMMRLLLGGSGDAVRTIRHGKSVAWRCKLGSTWWQEGTEGKGQSARPPPL